MLFIGITLQIHLIVYLRGDNGYNGDPLINERSCMSPKNIVLW